MAILCWEIPAAMITIIGIIHLAATLFTKAMHTKNPDLLTTMKAAPLNISNRLTFWKAWIGFNAAHSCGIIFVGVINFYLAWKYFKILQQDYVFSVLTVIAVLFYTWVARIYWFNGPFFVLLAALLLFLTGAVLISANK